MEPYAICWPLAIQKKSFKQIVNAPKGHFEPKPLIIAERFHFHRRNQAPGESIAEYVAKLWRLASKCDFRAYLEEALRNRLVCDLLSEPIQRALLSEVDLALKHAVKVAQGMEAAHKNAQALKASELPVHRLDQPTRVTGSHSFSSFKPAGVSTAGKACYCCGHSGHLPNDCHLRMLPATLAERKAILLWYAALLRDMHKEFLEDEALEELLIMWTLSSCSRMRPQMILNSST